MTEHGAGKNTAAAAGTAGFYDGFWTRYGPEPTADERVRIDHIGRAFREVVGRDGLEILDLGCGRGWMAPHLARWGRVTGIDFSTEGVAFARAHFADYGRFLLADPTSPGLGLPTHASFDLVICSEVIEHVVEPGPLLEQIRSQLRPGGSCILTTPNGRFWPAYRDDPRFRAGLQPIEHWLTPRDCAALFSRNGFEVRAHWGFPDPDYSPPVRGPWRHRRLAGAIRRLGLAVLERRRTLATELYQIIVASRRGCEVLGAEPT